MPRTEQYRRKTIIINPALQNRFIMALSVAPAIGLSLAMIAVCYFSYLLYREATVLDMRLEGLMPLFLSVSAFVLVSTVFLVSNSVKISHLVAGPAFRLCQSIKQIRGGNIGFKIALRKGDFLTEIRDELNLLFDTLNENPPSGFTTREMKATAAAENAEGEDGGRGEDQDHADAADPPGGGENERVTASAANSND